MDRTFIFQGMCYSGKSTLGKIIADAIGIPFLDSRDLFFKIIWSIGNLLFKNIW